MGTNLATAGGVQRENKNLDALGPRSFTWEPSRFLAILISICVAWHLGIHNPARGTALMCFPTYLCSGPQVPIQRVFFLYLAPY